MTSYCDYVRTHPEDEANRVYHDTEYGFPLSEDHLLFERFMLEINQAGLAWITILKKADNFRRAYDSFDVDRVAAYGKRDVTRLLSDAGIIRNRLKSNAAIENAKRIQALRNELGSFKGWLEVHNSLTLEEWTKLFKITLPLPKMHSRRLLRFSWRPMVIATNGVVLQRICLLLYRMLYCVTQPLLRNGCAPLILRSDQRMKLQSLAILIISTLINF